MNLGTLVFLALTGVTLAGGIGVVATRNVVYGAFFLLVALVGVAGIFILLLAEFLALVQVLIYGGAVTIVLLFAVMLTQTPEQRRVQDNPQRPLAVVAALVSLFLFSLAALTTPWKVHDDGAGPAVSFQELGIALFRDWGLPFEIASLVLLVALVGAVVIARAREEP
ncbi:MAG: NADH-quinone oxidoreductase subunit J [Chloroflexi bacterium]|nr:NADH-quinone oxidoreductase subunit J [Chloroflexota bacterium]